MKNYQPKYRWKLSEQQKTILIYLHKFRFVTSDILAEILEKDRSTVYERLSVLVSQRYVLKRYDSTYRLRRRPASYCLAPLGIRTLKDDERVEQISLRQNYKNKSCTEEQIDDCLNLANIYFHFRHNYAKHLDCYTKYQLNRDKLIRPTPVLFIRGKTNKIPDYYLDIFPALTMSWIIRKRINDHVDFADESNAYYPHLLLVAGNDNTERRVIKMTSEMQADFEIFTTTIDRLLSGEKKIWIQVFEWDEYEEPVRIALPLRIEEE